MSQTSINQLGQPKGRAGQLSTFAPVGVDSGFNAEASATVTFGIAVKRLTTDPTGRGFVNLAASTDTVAGVVVYGYGHQFGTTGDLNATGDLIAKAELDILFRGRIMVTVEEAVSPDDRAYVRCVANAPNNTIGAWRKSADSTNVIDVTRNCKFITGAAAGGLAEVEVDFTIKAG